MPERGTMRLAAPTKDAQKTIPLEQRGRMLYVRDVLELLPKTPDGRPVKSEWWVRNKFAPEYKRHLGRQPYWWEFEALKWLDSDEAAA